MKTTIYELLGMIKDDKAPIKIFYRGRGRLFKYDCDTKDYYCNDFDEYLFDEYIVTSILDDEVEILDNTENNKQDKIEKLEQRINTGLIGSEIISMTDHANRINRQASYISDIVAKINEIIDRLNNV